MSVWDKVKDLISWSYLTSLVRHALFLLAGLFLLITVDAAGHWIMEYGRWAGAEEEAVGAISARDVIGFVLDVGQIAWAITLIGVMAFDTYEVIRTRSQQYVGDREQNEP